MTKQFRQFLATAFFLSFSLSILAGEQEDLAIKAYTNAMLSGDLKKLDSLLSPDFEYRYYKDGEWKKLSREEELEAMSQLFNDAAANAFNELERFRRSYSSKYNMQFVIIFEDSPKTPTESLFRGAVLDVDENLVVSLENNKIKRIVEARDRVRKNKLSFGFLKFIYLGNTDSVAIEKGNELIIKLMIKSNQELLLTKKVLDVEHKYMEESFHWPNNHRIENFE